MHTYDLTSTVQDTGNHVRATRKPRTRNSVDVAIIGAGPYGLSIAAHLVQMGIDHRIIGIPMDTWLNHMPKGMSLKSEGNASSLYDAKGTFSLGHYCAEHGIKYADLGVPVPLDVFTEYGLAFQRRLVPSLECKTLARLEQSPSGFHLVLDDHEEFTARCVIVATGISHFKHMPPELAQLPPEVVSHSSQHRDLSCFKARDVTVIGAGASAIDLATLLHEGGANCQLVARNPMIKVASQMRLPRPLLDRIRCPMSGIGPSWRSLFYSRAPHLFHLLPEHVRLPRAKRYLGPEGGYFMRERFGHVPQLNGFRLRRVDIVNGRPRLILDGCDGSVQQIETDHIIAATGFRVDLRRLPFLSDTILARLKSIENTPVLSSYFQSSLPGLYFVGPAAANSFGPLMRFAVGARFTAPRIARALTTALV